MIPDESPENAGTPRKEPTQAESTRAPPHDEMQRTILRSEHLLRQVFLIFLALFVGGSITLGAWTLWHMDASLGGEGADFPVSTGLLVAVAVTFVAGVAVAIWLMQRKQKTPPEGFLRALDLSKHTLGRALQVLLGIAAGGVVAAGIWMIQHMDPSSRSQAGDVFVGIGILVALGCIAAMYVSIERRFDK